MAELVDSSASPAILAVCDGELEPFASATIGKLASRIRQDHAKAVQTVHIGWTVLTARIEDDGIRLFEPNYDSNPSTELRPDISCSLRILKSQLDLLEQLGLEGQPVNFEQKLVLEQRAVKEKRVYLHRQPTDNPADSGWFLGITSSPMRRKLEAIQLWQLLGSRPELMRVLLLPNDYIAAFNGAKLDSVSDPENREIYKNS